MTSIYTITTIHSASENHPFSSGCIAWYSQRDDALNDIESNAGDMHECYFDYLVLEEVSEFQLPDAKIVAWFHWEDGWVECERPKELEGVCNWSIG